MSKRRVNIIKESLSKIRSILGESAEFTEISCAVWNFYQVRFGNLDFDL